MESNTLKELRTFCKERCIKCYSKLNKPQLIQLLSQEQQIISINTETLSEPVLETISENYNNEINKQIREKVFENHGSVDIKELANEFNKTQVYIKQQIAKISKLDILKNKHFTDHDIQTIQTKRQYICNECDNHCHVNNKKQWGENIICNGCWNSPNKKKDRNDKWEHILRESKTNLCNICGIERTNQNCKFNYDHINMFDKVDAVSNMINCGIDMDTIMNEINKCQLLCYDCHNTISDIETEYGFIQYKTSLTKKLNSDKITIQEYNQEIDVISPIYIDKMTDVYNVLKSFKNMK